MGGLNIQRLIGRDVGSASSFARAAVTGQFTSHQMVSMEVALEQADSKSARNLASLLVMVREGWFQTREARDNAERVIKTLAQRAIRFESSGSVVASLESVFARRMAQNYLPAQAGSSQSLAPPQMMGSRRGGARGKSSQTEEISSVSEAKRSMDEAKRLEKSASERAIRLYEKVIAFYRKEGFVMEEVGVLAKLELLLYGMERFDKRYFELLERSVRLYLSLRKLKPAANISLAIGQAKAVMGSYEEAIAAFEKAAAIWEALGDSDNQALCLYKKAGALQDAGKIEEAWEALVKAQKLFGSHMPPILFPDFVERLWRFLEAMPDSFFDANVLELLQAHGKVEPSRISSIERDVDEEIAEGHYEVALLGLKSLLVLYRGDQAASARVRGKIEKIERNLGKKPS